MLGTFAPNREPYVHTLEEETTPSGVLARGLYSAKLKVHLQFAHVYRQAYLFVLVPDDLITYLSYFGHISELYNIQWVIFLGNICIL